MLTPLQCNLWQVVREVYLPQSGLWLSDYPFVDRNAFLDLSIAVERQRQQAEYDVTAVWVDTAAEEEAGRGGIYSDPRDLDLGGTLYQSPGSQPQPPSVSSVRSSRSLLD